MPKDVIVVIEIMVIAEIATEEIDVIEETEEMTEETRTKHVSL